MDDTRDVVFTLCTAAYAAMECELDETVGRTCILQSPLTTLKWTCLVVKYELSSNDVQLTLDLLADGVSHVNRKLLANNTLTVIKNEGLGSSIRVQLTASRLLVSTADYEFALVSSVTFHNCTIPEGLRIAVNCSWQKS